MVEDRLNFGYIWSCLKFVEINAWKHSFLSLFLLLLSVLHSL
jgi:hypothetical protein